MDEEQHNQVPHARNSDTGSIEDAKVEEKDEDELEAVELILFHVKECYVYLIPPRKTAASYRADEWNVNKWHWEGALKVVSKGEECIIRLEDRATGEPFARAFLRKGEPNPVEPVIDSSRYFVLRVEESIGGRLRHAFIGVGFRERPQAYDFQAALHDHVKYLNKKQTAEEMVQHFQAKSSADYSLKEGETLVLQIKNKGGGSVSKLLLKDKQTAKEEGSVFLKPPPPAPSATLSPTPPTIERPPNSGLISTSDESRKIQVSEEENSPIEDDFGDFQEAG